MIGWMNYLLFFVDFCLCNFLWILIFFFKNDFFCFFIVVELDIFFVFFVELLEVFWFCKWLSLIEFLGDWSGFLVEDSCVLGILVWDCLIIYFVIMFIFFIICEWGGVLLIFILCLMVDFENICFLVIFILDFEFFFGVFFFYCGFYL